MEKIKVVCALGSDEIKNNIANALNCEEIEFIGTDAVYRDGVIPLVTTLDGHVILISTMLKDGISFQQIIKTLKTEKPSLKVIVIAAKKDDEELINWLHCNGIGNILDGEKLDVDVLKEAILEAVELPAPKERLKIVEKVVEKKIEVPVEIIQERFVTTVVVSVFNITRGSGSTTTALHLAHTLKKEGHKVCTIEMNTSGDFKRIGNKYNGVGLYPFGSDYSDIISTRKYDYVVLDYGLLYEFDKNGLICVQSDSMMLNEFKRSAVRVAVCSINPWNEKKLSFYIENEEWQNLRYLITNGAKTNTIPKGNCTAINRDGWEYAILSDVLSKSTKKRLFGGKVC